MILFEDYMKRILLFTLLSPILFTNNNLNAMNWHNIIKKVDKINSYFFSSSGIILAGTGTYLCSVSFIHKLAQINQNIPACLQTNYLNEYAQEYIINPKGYTYFSIIGNGTIFLTGAALISLGGLITYLGIKNIKEIDKKI